MEQWPDAFQSCSQFTGSNFSYRLKFFVAKYHLRSSSLSNCSLRGSRFARSCSTRPSQRSKYTEGVVLRMRICIAVQRKCVQKKKNTPSHIRRCSGARAKAGRDYYINDCQFGTATEEGSLLFNLLHTSVSANLVKTTKCITEPWILLLGPG